jgi:2,3-bisphosphoglycerate-dependent phosphoglycerate mutase
MTIKLLIARHGNTFGPGDTVRRVGTTDLSLVESGLAQGRALGLHLKENHLIPDIIFTSQLKRAIETAEQAQMAMRTQISTKILDIFNEIDYGIDENKPEEEVIARVGIDALKAWEKNAEVPSGWKVNPSDIVRHWHDFANTLIDQYADKIVLVITSNGIARFAPFLTGDFSAFCAQYGIKLSTGAFGVFQKKSSDRAWHCSGWNIKPIVGQ